MQNIVRLETNSKRVRRTVTFYFEGLKMFRKKDCYVYYVDLFDARWTKVLEQMSRNNLLEEMKIANLSEGEKARIENDPKYIYN